MAGLLRQNINIAQQSIKGQFLRTALTVIIIAIGITALVGILSSVRALESTIGGGFSGIGANTFSMQRYPFTMQRRGGGERVKVNPIISYREVKDFENQWDYPFSQVGVSFQATSQAEVKSEDRKTKPKVIISGVNANYVENAGLTIHEGRGFSSFDIKNNGRVCVIGSDMEDELFQGLNPIGQVLSIRGNKFTVVGLLEEKGSTFGNNIDLRVLIPIDVARSIYTSPNINYDLSVKVKDDQFMEGAKDRAIVLFRNIRGLAPVEENNFGVIQSDQLLGAANEIKVALYAAGFIISIITIFGSSIALMNIMLVSVTERTREIGVRKALGAKRSTISWQFFIETMLISQYGSILGILFGILIGYIVSNLLEVEFLMPWTPVIWATIISIIIAIFSGVIPAIKAARLDPIEALRHE
ncbi:ABC transporter permease [Nonlabens mediterrranea]|uniref:ABC transporter permease n=1 Tax=Nonlabens mediterrranea TaxID=1419947 RepID=A0ABS0A6L1_9FLAO|nr:ABC transporter efflux protein [Flavobacteria bacterium BBFL7]MBF4984944.1 ABC transporter permease [Nonlabens mediterrranea]